MSNQAKDEKKSKGPKQESVDHLYDVVSAVEAYDKARLSKADEALVQVLHAKAVKKITSVNNIRGQGYISISKARAITQAVEAENKVQLGPKFPKKAA
ncbi:MAG: hypothetical protein PHY47_00750 [Lachnospiraceae bacterium]|nr:hypothetical protein [Lachnospiraceae bacterium]